MPIRTYLRVLWGWTFAEDRIGGTRRSGASTGRSELLLQRLHARNAERPPTSESTPTQSPIVRERSRLSGNARKPRKAAASGLSNVPVSARGEQLADGESCTAQVLQQRSRPPMAHRPVRSMARLLAATDADGERSEKLRTARRLDSGGRLNRCQRDTGTCQAIRRVQRRKARCLRRRGEGVREHAGRRACLGLEGSPRCAGLGWHAALSRGGR